MRFSRYNRLNIIELTGEVSIDGVLDKPFWKEATHYEIKLETYPALLEPSSVNKDIWIAIIDTFF